MTKREKIERIMNIEAVRADEIAMEFLNKELELLNNKKNKDSEKAKEKAKADETMKIKILHILNIGDKAGMTATQILKAYNDDEITVQKIVKVLRDLIDECKVVRYMCKKVPYFTLWERGVE